MGKLHRYLKQPRRALGVCVSVEHMKYKISKKRVVNIWHSVSGMSSSGRKHASEKSSCLPNDSFSTPAVYVRRKLTFTTICSGRLTAHFDALFNQKNASDTTSTNIASPT